MNDLVLVRDLTSGTFAPCYMPNYRIVTIHGQNRITVRDEKGNESVRRASHLKVFDWEEKVTSMVPDPREYDKFGRSTKLLIHPKDIPNVQFDKQADNKSEIPPEAENSVAEVNAISGRENTVRSHQNSCQGRHLQTLLQIMKYLWKLQICVKEGASSRQKFKRQYKNI